MCCFVYFVKFDVFRLLFLVVFVELGFPAALLVWGVGVFWVVFVCLQVPVLGCFYCLIGFVILVASCCCSGVAVGLLCSAILVEGLFWFHGNFTVYFVISGDDW